MKLINKDLPCRIFRKMKKIFITNPYEFIQAEMFFHTIKRKMDDNDFIIILSDLIGDIVYGLSYLTAIHNTYPDEKVIIIGNKKQKKLVESYRGIDKLILLEPGKWLNRKNAFMHSSIVSEKGLKNKIYNSNPFFIRKCYKANQSDTLYQLKKHVYKIPLDSIIDYHNMIDSNKVTAIKNFEKIKNKVIVINPYSNSLSKVSMSLYENLCNCLLEKGYIVYTNVVGEQKPIKGSKELRCSIDELYTIVSKIPVIISVRSGILDFLAPSQANMFVLYENCGERLKKMYHLSSWNCNGRIKEIYFDSEKEIVKITNQLKLFLKIK